MLLVAHVTTEAMFDEDGLDRHEGFAHDAASISTGARSSREME